MPTGGALTTNPEALARLCVRAEDRRKQHRAKFCCVSRLRICDPWEVSSGTVPALQENPSASETATDQKTETERLAAPVCHRGHPWFLRIDPTHFRNRAALFHV